MSPYYQQTMDFLKTAEFERVKVDLHFYAAGNLGLVAFSAHLLLYHYELEVDIDMAMWAKVSFSLQERFIFLWNAVVYM